MKIKKIAVNLFAVAVAAGLVAGCATANYNKSADTAATLTRILREDLRTTFIPVARDTVLNLKANGGTTIAAIYGYPDRLSPDGKSARIPLGELNVDDWRILVAEVSFAGANPSNRHMGITASASVKDPSTQKLETVAVSPVPTPKDLPFNPSVARNSIAFADAMALLSISDLVKKENYQA